MNIDFDKNINWELIIHDTFDHSSYIDKSGNNILEGFYHLWFFLIRVNYKNNQHQRW